MRLAPKVVLLATLAVLAACGEPTHKNRYDPQTPPESQARATLVGAVTLEPLGVDPPDLSGVHISVPGAGSVDTAEDGTWTLLHVPAGSYTIQATKPGYVAAALAGVVVRLDDGDSIVTVPQLSLAVARGTVEGTAIASGASDPSGTVVTVSGGPDSATAVTDAAGRFVVHGLPVGTGYVATYRRTAYATQTSPAFAVTTGAITTVPAATLSLATTASLSGTASVERPAGANDGIAVSLTGADVNGAPVARSTFTSTDGSYSLPGLPQGTYSLSFSKAAYDARSIAGLFVAAGANATHPEVTLPVAKGTVAGTVSLSAGAVTGFPVGTDRSGVVVTLSGVDVPVAAAVTDPAGAYQFNGVPVSTSGSAYTVAAQKPSFVAATTTVTAVADATATAPAMTLTVDGGALSGTVLLRDEVGGAGDNATHAGTSVSVTGTAFNGASWSAGGTTALDGTFTIPSLPPGSYDVVAVSTDRTCEAFPAVVVPPGTVAAAPTVRCLDALAPTAVALGAPLPPTGGQSGYTVTSSVLVPISTAATDATSPASNFRGYQVVVGSAADWSAASLVAGQPATLTFPGLAPNSVNTLWARAVDWTGNAGPVATSQVITDSIAPPAPTLATPRPFVNATTTSVTLSGSEGDANFAGYEICSFSQAATVTCPASAPAGCAWTATAAAFAISLVANERTCLYARAFDRAGNRSGPSSLGTGGVVSDLVPPAPPVFAPTYDPTLLVVRAPSVDFFVTGASTDQPAGGVAWKNVAWLEVDTGAGFAPLCPWESCRPGGTYAPCGCACSDSRLLCDGTRLVGVRAPLLQGTRNVVAMRAVDLAGNVGSGVAQQVEADSTGDVLAATAASENNTNVRGSIVTYAQFNPGAGNPHGIILDLGSNRRYDVTDLRCDVTPSVATGYGRAIFPASDTLVVTAEYGSGARMIRAGADGRLCTGDDTSAIFRTPAAGFFVDGVSGFGEKATWWERQNSPAAANAYVREPGANGVFGDGDDVTVLVGAYNYVSDLVMGERALLLHIATCGDGCSTYSWRVINPNASGSWTSGRTQVDLPSSVTSAALSVDGRVVAWIEAGPTLKVRQPGANGRFDTTDDVTVSIPVPFPLSTSAELAIDGPHVVALAAGSPLSWMVHWWAGPDGGYGTADDVVERIQPTGGARQHPSIAASYLALSLDGDAIGLDLAALRWEIAPTSGMDLSHPLEVDGRGWLVYKAASGNPVARSPAGAETTAPFSTGQFVADGKELLEVGSGVVRLRAPDPAGAWFTAGAPAPVDVYAYAPSFVRDLALGGGKGLVVDYAFSAIRGTDVAHYRVLEPGTGGTLATLPATGSVVDVLPDGVRRTWAFAGAITRDQVFYACHDWATSSIFLCVHNAGPDGVFGTGDDPRPATYASAVRMFHPAGSPRAGLPVSDARALEVSGRRMILSEFSPAGVYLFDAGADGLFNTSDDRGRKLADVFTTDVAASGDWAAYLDNGPPAGRQVWLVRGLEGAAAPVTSHYSAKVAPALEPSGRLFWVDSVFVPEAVFVRSP